VFLKNALTGHNGHNADVTYHIITFTGKKSSLPEACPAEEIAFEIAEFFPTGRFLY
jgi:hypothetical protein